MPAIKFCGCSVTGFTSQLGWGGNKSSLEVNVIQDERNGDFFNPPLMGQPAYFYFGPSYHFWGLLQSWTKNDSKQGRDIYSLKIEDPRDILAGTQVILSQYNGGTFGVANILNVFGYWENTLGYGGADVNEGGMPWYKVLAAVQTMTNLPMAGPYGGSLSFMGVNYAVDLSRLPVPPVYYRVGGGPSRSLLDLIQEICEDGGCDFFVELDPGTTRPIIRVYTVSRYNQPPLGTIAQLANEHWGIDVVRTSNGLELRNEPTTHFLLGGEQTSLYQTTSLTPFWGYDINGNPIPNLIAFIPGLGYCNAAFVNAQEVSGAFNNGAQYYFLTEFELRAALGDTKDAWERYVVYEGYATQNFKHLLIGPLGIRSMMGAIPQIQLAQAQQVYVDFLRNLPSPMGSANIQIFAQEQVKEFVKRIAQNWYGKKYWVPLPFVLTKADQETLQVHHSSEICDAGWIPAGAVPLGIRAENRLKFMSDDGRWEALAVFNPAGIDLQNVSPEDAALQTNGFFTRINVDRAIYNWPQTGIPNCVVTITNPVSMQLAHVGGDIGMLGTIFQEIENPNILANPVPGGGFATTIWQAFQGARAFGAVHLRIAPPRKPPSIVAIPIRSTTTTYGPWFIAGPAGKVVVEQSTDLVPWEYGNEDIMNLAANSKVTTAVTFMQAAETGQVEQIGMPLTSLGQTLMMGGPEVTNIEVRYGGDGIRTSYHFRSFTDTHLNRFVRGTQDRLKRLGRTQTEVKKAMLLAITKSSVNNLMTNVAAAQALARFPKWEVAWASPSPVIIATAIRGTGSGLTAIRTSTAICDAQEGWGGIGITAGSTGIFQNSALVGLSQFFRPFTMNMTNPPSGNLLPKPDRNAYISPPPSALLSFFYLNPYASGNFDVEFLLSGNYPDSGGSFRPSLGIDYLNVRGVGLSMPMMCVGWGVDIYGSQAPLATDPSSSYKVGPMDLTWDGNRCVWTTRDSLMGIMRATCAPSGGNALMGIMGAQTGAPALRVYNYWSAPVAAGKKVCVNYQPYLSTWAIIAADCP